MNVTYGQGTYLEKKNQYSGTIILSDHKVYIVKDGNEISETFIPLEKIESIRLSSNRLIFNVRPAIMSRFQASIEGDKKNIHDLAQEIVARRGLKKKFLKNEWFEKPL